MTLCRSRSRFLHWHLLGAGLGAQCDEFWTKDHLQAHIKAQHGCHPPAAAPTPPRRRVWFSGARRGTAAESSGSGAAAGARGNDVVTEPPVGDDGAAAGAEGNDAVMEPPDVVEIVDEGGAVVEEVVVECIVVASDAEGGGSDEEDDARQRTGGRRDARRRTGDVTIVGENRRRVGPRGLPHVGVDLRRWGKERQYIFTNKH